jgi:hypothetical protein
MPFTVEAASLGGRRPHDTQMENLAFVHAVTVLTGGVNILSRMFSPVSSGRHKQGLRKYVHAPRARRAPRLAPSGAPTPRARASYARRARLLVRPRRVAVPETLATTRLEGPCCLACAMNSTRWRQASRSRWPTPRRPPPEWRIGRTAERSAAWTWTPRHRLLRSRRSPRR